jgi:C-terminal peptidase prc
MRKKIFAAALALCLTLSATALPASALEVEDARTLLQNYYVDPIPDSILSLDSIDAILDALGDPYTVYMTAEEYQAFLSAVNGEVVVGIGVSIQNTYDNGYQIMSVLPDSPAQEAGLSAGDRIVAVDGRSLTSSMDVRALIAGEAGTYVTITVVRSDSGQRQDYTLARRAVTIPIVTYGSVGTAGVIDCTSFGSSTVETIQEALEALDAASEVWIMDLRSNPGGTSDAAAGSAGLFVGSAIMVYFRNAQGVYNYLYTLPSCPDLTDKPLIILTSAYSASGSELFAAAARDYAFGIAVGQRTFGKGIAQIILDDSNTTGLFNGDAMKITAYRFYSPDGATNHNIGVLPTLLISAENTPNAALLLSQPAPAQTTGYLKLEIAGQALYLEVSEAVNSSNRDAFTELLEALPPSALLYEGTGGQTWAQIAPERLAASLGLTYTPRTFSDIADSSFAREIQTLATYQLLSGYGDGTFRPERTMTRAEFCAMVATALNLTASGSTPTFSDVNAGDWYAGPVAAMAAKGFLSGYEDGTFRPNNTMTYEEMVTILAAISAWASMEGEALAQEEIPADNLSDYAQFSPWAQRAAWTLDELNALVGQLDPSDSSTRAVAAGTLCTLMESIHLLWD